MFASPWKHDEKHESLMLCYHDYRMECLLCVNRYTNGLFRLNYRMECLLCVNRYTNGLFRLNWETTFGTEIRKEEGMATGTSRRYLYKSLLYLIFCRLK